MGKSIGGLLFGALVAVVVFMGLSSPFPMTATSGNTGQPYSLGGNLTAYYESVTSLLIQAAEKIQDEDLAEYYQKLIGRYELDQPSSWLAPGDSEDEEAVPDMERISRQAISLPLREVSDRIEDEGIAEFCRDFLPDQRANASGQ